jgi:hypothetical protein
MRVPVGGRGGWSRSLGLHCGQGTPGLSQMRAWMPSQGASGWSSHTQPTSSQGMHVHRQTVCCPIVFRGLVAFIPAVRLRNDSKCAITSNSNSHPSDRSERPLSATIELCQNEGDQYAKANLHYDYSNCYRHGFYQWLLCGRPRIDGARERHNDDGLLDEHDRHEHRHQ